LEVSYVLADGFGQSCDLMSEQEREFIIDAAVMMSEIRVWSPVGWITTPLTPHACKRRRYRVRLGSTAASLAGHHTRDGYWHWSSLVRW
jgi:hypothetical protein